MAHVFLLVEGRELWMDIFLNDLLKKRYFYKRGDGQSGYIQPNPREIKIFDVSLNEQCIPALMNDLTPFANNTTKLRGKAHILSETLRNVAGLHSIYDLPPFPDKKTALKNRILELFRLKKAEVKDEYKPTFDVRKRWVNIIPVGWAEDKKVGSAERPLYPVGGELV